MINEAIRVSQDLFMAFIVAMPTLYFLWFLWMCFCYKDDENNSLESVKTTFLDPFIISFRKTRIESMIISRVDEIEKKRDVQCVVSCYYYNNDKSIKGCIYVITSKVLYKLFFIKNSLITREICNFSTFISPQNNKSYNNLYNYLSNVKYYNKQPHHNEFFTWSHYYLTGNYIEETEMLEKFLKSL